VSYLRYITHSDAAVEPSKPSTRWGLSPWGLERARALLDEPWTATIGRIVSSDETKAMETAGVLAAHVGLQIEVRARTGENDRSATGYVPPEEFELLDDWFQGVSGRRG